MVWIKPGNFTMGSPKSEIPLPGREQEEAHQVDVELTRGFWMARWEVTQEDFETVVGHNPSFFTPETAELLEDFNAEDTSRFPVETMSWYDAVDFCNRLSERHGVPSYYKMEEVRMIPENDAGKVRIESAVVTIAGGNGYRLPTEAEWEYACRAGTTTPFHFGSTLDRTMAKVYDFEPRNPVDVGTYPPNAWGLHGMHGNVREMCFDLFDTRLPGGADPVVTKSSYGTGRSRVVKGGSWYDRMENARSGYRTAGERGSNGVGFRVVRSAAKE